ncbi:MAG: multidrug efflux pump subunit AcrA (membrane-fusion protein) [Limisphaerales bacterium]|jgi:multidrug efflux pump subunit AcrA (membrane-fusion protein)
MNSLPDILLAPVVLNSEALKKNPPVRNIRLMLALLLICAGSLAVALVKLPWQQTASGHGQVVAFSQNERIQNLDAPLSGRINRWFVQEGDMVTEGDPIAEILDIAPDILARLKQEQDAVKKRLAAAKLSEETARRNVERQEKAVAKGLSAPREFEKARLEWAKHLSDEAKAAEDLAKVEVRLSRQGAQLVTAPSTARVQRRMAGEGGVLVSAGSTLAVMRFGSSLKAGRPSRSVAGLPWRWELFQVR